MAWSARRAESGDVCSCWISASGGDPSGFEQTTYPMHRFRIPPGVEDELLPARDASKFDTILGALPTALVAVKAERRA